MTDPRTDAAGRAAGVLASQLQAKAVTRFDEHGPHDLRGAAIWDCAAWLTESDEARLADALLPLFARVAADAAAEALGPLQGLRDLWTEREMTDSEYAMYQELRIALVDARAAAVEAVEPSKPSATPRVDALADLIRRTTPTESETLPHLADCPYEDHDLCSCEVIQRRAAEPDGGAS